MKKKNCAQRDKRYVRQTAGAVGQASGEADLPCRAKRRYYKKAYEEIEKLLDRIDVLLRHESPEFDSLQLNAYDDYFMNEFG